MPATRPWLSTPLGVALLGVATATALPVVRWGDGPLVLIIVPAGVAAYLVGRWMPSFAAAVTTFVTVLVLSLPVAFLLPEGAPFGDWMTSALIVLLVVVLPWWAGRYRLLRAAQHESDAMVVAERAQASERARIADDLHDTIGHELALIAVQAGALELGRDLTDQQRTQFQELREAAVRASERLREVVRLAEPEGPGRLEPLHGEDIDALITGARDAGMVVEAHIDSDAVAQVHPLIAELALRTIREGLTNAARHAPGIPVEIDLDGTQPGLAVSVRTALTRREGPVAAGSGHGIPGLRRRAEALGANLAAAAVDDVFTLSLRAPQRPAPAGTGSAGAVDAELQSNARTARRGALQAAFVPMTMVAVAIAVFLAVQAITAAQTAISSSAYAGIELGMTRDELASVLPGGIPSPAPVVDEPAVPVGAVCEYFAARDGWLHFTDATYRLCFREGVLVQKLLLEAE